MCDLVEALNCVNSCKVQPAAPAIRYALLDSCLSAPYCPPVYEVPVTSQARPFVAKDTYPQLTRVNTVFTLPVRAGLCSSRLP